MPLCASAAPSCWIQAGSLYPAAAHLEYYSTSEPSSRVTYQDITDLEGRGIDFVARITCCCSVHVPAGMAFIFGSGGEYSLCRTPCVPSLAQQAGMVSNFSLLLHLKDSPFSSHITLAPLGRFSSIKLSLLRWKN